MAIIPIYHVVADQLPTDQADVDIEAGQLVQINNDGTATLADATHVVYGIAGDTKSDTTAGTAYADDVIMGAYGSLSRSTQNRVSDFYNETGASGLITVYNQGGKFATDQWVDAEEANLTPGTLVYSNAAGLITDVAGGGVAVCGVVVSAPAAYPSGVPGTDINGSMSLGNYLIIKLTV